MKKIILLILMSFITFAGYSQLPTFEGFEGATFPPTGWLVTDNGVGSTQNWKLNAPNPPWTAYEPTPDDNAAFVDRENTGQGIVSEEWLITPQQNILANRQLRFFTRQTVPGDTQTKYQIRVSSDPVQSNLAAYTVLIEYSELDLSTLTPDQVDYEEKVINLAFTGNRYFAFVKVNTQAGTATSGDRWLVDAVKIVQRCVEPTALTVSNVSANGATLGWSGPAGATYTVEYGPSGFLPGTGTIITGVTGTTLTIPVLPDPPLTPSTDYQFYVTAVCTSLGSSSEQTGPFNFTTVSLGSACGGPIVVPALPYSTNDDTLQYGNNITNGTPGSNCTAGSGFLDSNDVVYLYTVPATTTGLISVTMNPLGATNTGVFVYTSCANVGVNCIAGAGNATAAIRNIPQIAVTPGQTIYVVISSTAATESFDYTLIIQDVNCAQPVALGLTTPPPANPTTTQALLKWTNGPGGTSTSWQVVVQAAGTPIPSFAGVTTSNNTTFPGSSAYFVGGVLTPGLPVDTALEFWVRADCGNGTFSAWSGPFQFNTLPTCPAPTALATAAVLSTSVSISFTNNSSATEFQYIVLPTGNPAPTIGSTGFTIFNTTNYTILGLTPDTCYDIYVRANCGPVDGFSQWVPLINICTQIAPPECGGTFVDAGGSAGPYPNNEDSTITICPTNPGDLVTVTFTAFNTETNWDGLLVYDGDSTVDPQISSGNGPGFGDLATLPGAFWGTTIPGPFTSSSLDGCLTFRFISDAIFNFDGFIANVTCAPAPPCPKSTTITASAITTTTATISWLSPPNATSFEILVLPAGSPAPLPGDVGAPAGPSPFVLTGLTPDGCYDVYIRNNCGADGLSDWSTVFASFCALPTCPKPTDLVIGNVLSTSIELSFTNNSTATTFDVLALPCGSPAPTAGSTGFTTTSTITGYLITTLSPDTCYDIYVRANCGPGDLSTWAGPATATTQQVPPECGGTYSDPGGSSANYPPLSDQTVTICPPAGQFVTVTFTQFDTETNWDGILVYDGNSIASPQISSGNGPGFGPIGAFTGAFWGAALPGPFESSSLDGCLTFRFISDGSVQFPGFVANVICAPVPPCLKPTAIASANVTTTTATISWTSPNNAVSYEILALPAGSPAPLPGDVGIPASANPFDVTGLTPDTCYDVYVRNNCGPIDGFSVWSTVFTSFCTLPTCPKPTNLILTNVLSTSLELSFTNNSTATTFDVLVLSCGSPAPTAGATGFTSTSSVSNYLLDALTPDTCYDIYVRANCGPGDLSTWAGPATQTTQQIPPACGGTFSDPGGSSAPYPAGADNTVTICAPENQLLTITFTQFNTEENWDGLLVYDGNSTAAPQISSGNGPGFGNLATLPGAFWGSTIPGPFVTTAPGGCLTFRFISDGSFNEDGWVATVECAPPPTCPAPINLQASQLSINSATLTWDQLFGPAVQWQVIVQPQNGPAPDASSTGDIVNGTPPTITYIADHITSTGDPLVAGVFYEYYVQALCPDSDESTWTGPVQIYISPPPPVCAGVNIEITTDPPGTINFCSGNNTQELTASYTDSGDTTIYGVSEVPYAPPFPFTGGQELTVDDDDLWSAPFSLPFNFCFFGTNYQSVQIGSNGVVSFTTTYPVLQNGSCQWNTDPGVTVPNPLFPIRNAIYGVYQDIDPSVPGTTPSINYQVLGTAPCRALVINYYQLGQFFCLTDVGLQTSQIVLYETSNIIEVYIQDRTTCLDWNEGSGVVGIQNTAGTQGYTPPGRNLGTWEAHNEAWRFTPAGPSNVSFAWFQDGGPTPISTDTTITVDFTETTVLTAQATYTGCGGETVVETEDIILQVNPIDLPPIEDVSTCDPYELPVLPNVVYYDAPGGPTGTGNVITGPITELGQTTIYAYATTATTPPCSDEESFIVEIGQAPVPELPDVSDCSGFTLPDLTVIMNDPNYSGNYYSDLDGTGTMYPGTGGTVISTVGITTLFIYNATGTCIGQTSFDINIGPITAPIQPNVFDCNGFILPEIADIYTYYTLPGGPLGGGTIIPDLTNITTTQTIYIWAQDGDCTDESDFLVTIDGIVPTFDPIADICLNGPAPILPTMSTNVPPIEGTWSCTIDTTTPGTTTCTFNPDLTIPGQECATTATLTVTVINEIVPVFTLVTEVCIGSTLALPANDDNGITGSWSPTSIDTSAAGTVIATFTPDTTIPSQSCAIPTNVTFTINSVITPTFPPVANVCQNASAPVLPASNEGISGTWSPSTVDTSTPGTFTFTFTPDVTVAGQECAVPADITITVDPGLVPTFAPIADICLNGAAPALPGTSLEGIAGTWSPSIIDTSTAGTFTFIFTPNVTTCTANGILTVNIIPIVAPDFVDIGICSGVTPPTLNSQSPNGVSGTWSPATIDNTISGTYIFTPNAGQCATVQSIAVTVTPSDTPTFQAVNPLCVGTIAPVLSNISDNGISGTWSPATISTTTAGTTTYTFTPTDACDTIVTLDVDVNDVPQFEIAGACQGNNFVIAVNPGSSIPDNATYSWTFNGVPIANENGPEIIVTATGNYALTATTPGNCSNESIFVASSIACTIQRGISPKGTNGGDGKNDYFDLVGRNVRKLEIFNRYGTEVFGLTNYTNQWYGQSDNGNELPDGTYYYVIEWNYEREAETGWIYINREQ